ncbi:MAG: PHP domain-containing protein [Thermoproteota archaeon]
MHCHTTNSDGALSPLDVSRVYDKEGYDFVAFTDHGKVTKLTHGYGDVLLLFGEELSVGASIFRFKVC